MIIRTTPIFHLEKGVLPDSCSWLFVENIPLLFDKERITKQLKVETWLDLTQLLKELKDENRNESPHQIRSYVV